MTGFVTEEEMVRTMRGHLPELLRSDPSLGDHILSVAREHFPSKVETEDRFTRMLNELAREREAQSRKWAEQKAEDKRKWEEQKAEDKRRWDEQNRKWDEQNRKWEEQKAEDKRRWDEQNRKWEESNRRFDEVNEKVDRLARSTAAMGAHWDTQFDKMNEKVDRLARSTTAVGARWGTQSERAFRDALAAILEKSFGVEVLNVTEFDEAGEVFGQPDQVELDVIIKNGLLILCELKSSMSKSDMHAFARKVRFYEKRHHRQADRMIVVSPMIDELARPVGKKLGIELYPDSLEVPVR
ncbi:MAG: DUF3782 domain-containing protein [Candidatus Thiosymbion ectosymbiont of Robbea hypermnestra]|nr:DUF3782 domain-containing protein [Candidatus Thiosymbion ectosymbiont of Robbea hypermnestra]